MTDSHAVSLEAARSNAVRPGSPKAWLLAARPATLTAALSPVAVGTACALHEGALRAGPGLAAAAGAILLQISANFAIARWNSASGAIGFSTIL